MIRPRFHLMAGRVAAWPIVSTWGLSLVISCTGLAFGHGDVHESAPEEWAPSRDPIPGVRPFAEFLHRMDPRAVGLGPEGIQRSIHHLAAERTLRADGHDRDADYHRELAEEALLHALAENDQALQYSFLSSDPTTPSRAFSALIGGNEVALIEVVLPGEGTFLVTHRHHIGHQEETERYFTIPIGASGTQHVLLELEGLPTGQSIHHFALQREGEAEPFYWDALFVDAPEKGTVTVTLEGGSVPHEWAMVRLESLATGRLLVPTGSLDLSDIMDKISGVHGGNTGRGYHYQSPGPGQGVFHVTPGRFEMALAPGEYRLTARKGPEHQVATRDFTMIAGHSLDVVASLDRWIDLPSMGWHSGDDHVHAQWLHSGDAQRLMAFAKATDTHVVNLLEMGNERRTYFEQRAFGPTARMQSGNHVLVPGQEDPRYVLGHAIGLNMTGRIRDLDNYVLNDLWADALHDQGALYGHAHVGHKAFDIIRDMTLMIPRGKSDFSSILQGFLGTDYYFDFLDLGYRHAASAGSDTPYGTGVGSVRVYAHTGTRTLDADAWFEALGRGQSFVTQGPVILMTVGGGLPGTILQVEAHETLEASVTVLGMPGHLSPATLFLVMNSEVVHEVEVPEGVDEMTTVLPVDAGWGGWIVARVMDRHGAEAMTSPVYMEVEGLRPWNHPRVPNLLADRRATLADIEALLADLERRHEANQLWLLDYWNRRALDNIAELRLRIELVEGLLDELEDLHLRESSRRAATPAPIPPTTTPSERNVTE